jgi:hypothetical protein
MMLPSRGHRRQSGSDLAPSPHSPTLGRRCGPQVFALARAQLVGTEIGFFDF